MTASGSANLGTKFGGNRTIILLVSGSNVGSKVLERRGSGGEHYLVIRAASKGLWLDLPNNAAEGGFHPGFVCQW